jgi:hypothetical protein
MEYDFFNGFEFNLTSPLGAGGFPYSPLGVGGFENDVVKSKNRRFYDYLRFIK